MKTAPVWNTASPTGIPGTSAWWGPLELDDSSTVAVVGASISGFSTAVGLRQAGFGGRIVLIDPAESPYDRPPLSTEFLSGTVEENNLNLGAGDWAEEHRIEYLMTRVQFLETALPGVRPVVHTLHLVDGSSVDAHAVVLASGARAVPLEIDAGNIPVFMLRDKADAQQLQKVLGTENAHLAVAGSGLLGAEIASSARSLGAKVTLFASGMGSNAAVFGPRLAHVLFQYHETAGVTVVNDYLTQESFDAAQAQLPQGENFTAVIAAIGVAPRTKLAAQAGARIADGVVVDEGQRTTRPGILAVGDVARKKFEPSRKEHWDQAQADAVAAVATLLDQKPKKLEPTWVWSDRYGVSAQAVGTLPAGTDPEKLIHRDQGEVQASFLLDDNARLVWAATINDPMTIRAAKRLMLNDIALDPAAVADPSVSFRDLARGHR